MTVEKLALARPVNAAGLHRAASAGGHRDLLTDRRAVVFEEPKQHRGRRRPGIEQRHARVEEGARRSFGEIARHEAAGVGTCRELLRVGAPVVIRVAIRSCLPARRRIVQAELGFPRRRQAVGIFINRGVVWRWPERCEQQRAFGAVGAAASGSNLSGLVDGARFDDRPFRSAHERVEIVHDPVLPQEPALTAHRVGVWTNHVVGCARAAGCVL